jgi:hypothetical protein
MKRVWAGGREWIIQSDVPIPEPGKRGPNKARAIAKKGADAIRRQECSSISKAVEKYFPELESTRPTSPVIRVNFEKARKARIKDFAEYIAEDLQNGTMYAHVIDVLKEYANIKEINRRKGKWHSTNIE